ncbi:ABC-2 type transport system permease protein [Haloferula luteola]|uniref:ABC-2 type transport system permease protein n=1 Tax=Haloferula luteola TaxID=595692 RepID=A0A840UWD8_9BACT|nr:ABC transporter permease [Haloferula luteola]MBB5350102.1 ABC-2 type transport system permease protein [Haloferula luteola]
MSTLLILLRKEFKSFIYNPFGWVVVAAITLANGVGISTAMKGLIDTPSQYSLTFLTFHSPVFWFWFLFVFPLITMRLFAEEERSGTLETLLTAPVKTWHVVGSKYLAALIFFCIALLPTVVQFNLFGWVADFPDAWTPGEMLSTYLVFVLMGTAFTAIGCFASALTSSQIIAGLLTLAFLVLLYFFGYVPVIWGSAFRGVGVFDYISSQNHMNNFALGWLDTQPVVYYLSLAATVLFLTYHVVDYRRWKR